MDPIAVVRDARELAAQVLGKLSDYAQDEHAQWLEEAAETFVGDFELGEEDMLLLTPWLLFQHRRGGKTIAERFIEERGPSLSEVERAFFEAQRAAGFSWWHIVTAEGGKLTVRDLFTGEERQVVEPELEDLDQTGMVAFASVVEWNGVSMFTAMDANALPFEAVEVLVEAVGEEVSISPGSVPRERMQDQAVQQSLVSRWRQVVEALEGIEGEEVDEGGLLVTDHFEFAPGKRDEVLASLKKLQNVKFLESEDGLDSAVVLVPDEEDEAIGEITVGEDWLETDATEAWADEVKELVETVCGDLVKFTTREEANLDELWDEAGEWDDDDLEDSDEDEELEDDSEDERD